MFLQKIFYKTEDRGKIFKNLYWSLAEKTLLLISGIFVYAKVASYLGTESFGHFNYILSIYNIFLPLASLGLSNILVTKLLENGADKQKLMGTSAIMRFTGAILAILANSIFLFVIDGNWNYVILSFFMSWSYIFSAFLAIDEYFQSNLEARTISIIRIIVYTILIILKLVAIYYKASIGTFLFIYSLEFVLTILGGIIVYFIKKEKINNWKFSKETMTVLLKAMLPILITLIADTLYARYAVIVIKQSMNFSEVGIYSVAAKLGEVWYFIPSVICIALFPKIVKVFNENISYYKKVVSNIYSILFIISFAICIGAILLASPFIKILFDESYLNSIPIFKVYVFIGVLISLKTLNQRIYILENIQKYLVVFSVISSIICIGLFYILIPKYAGIGAAIAIIISQIFYIFVIPLFFKKTRPNVKYILRGIVPWNYFEIKKSFFSK